MIDAERQWLIKTRVHANSDPLFSVTPLSATDRPEALRPPLAKGLPLSRRSKSRESKVSTLSSSEDKASAAVDERTGTPAIFLRSGLDEDKDPGVI